MEEETAQGPKPNEFIVPEHLAYAGTFMETAEIAEYLLTKLVPVDIESLEANDRTCAICQEDFNTSEEAKLAHAPVKMVCGHIFGEKCIMKWLDPLCYWAKPGIGLRYTQEEVDDMRKHGKSTCPACRRDFFTKAFLEPIELLAARLFIWDVAYIHAGVARSAKEAHTRKYLWKYVKYCHLLNGTVLVGEPELTLLEGAQTFLLQYATYLKSQALTTVQEGLREKLQKLAEYNLRVDPMFRLMDGRSLISRAIAREGDIGRESESTDAMTERMS